MGSAVEPVSLFAWENQLNPADCSLQRKMCCRFSGIEQLQLHHWKSPLGLRFHCDRDFASFWNQISIVYKKDAIGMCQRLLSNTRHTTSKSECRYSVTACRTADAPGVDANWLLAASNKSLHIHLKLSICIFYPFSVCFLKQTEVSQRNQQRSRATEAEEHLGTNSASVTVEDQQSAFVSTHNEVLTMLHNITQIQK